MRRLEPRIGSIPIAGLVSVLVVCLLMAGCGRFGALGSLGSMRRGGEIERATREFGTRDMPRRPDASRELLASQQQLAAGQLDAAERAARDALKVDDRSAGAYTLLAAVAERRGEERKAGDHYRRALDLSPQQGDMLNNHGVWLCRNGRAAESIVRFEQALQDPSYRTPAVATANLGRCAAMAGDDARADAALRRAIELDPRNPVALGALAERELRSGDALRARAFSERRLAAAPADAQALRVASQIEMKLGDTKSAESYVRRLRAEFPQEPVDAGGNGAR